jgi:nitroreductase
MQSFKFIDEIVISQGDKIKKGENMVIQAIEKRFSVRKFKVQPIEQDKLNEIFQAARLAPSARNLQPWRLVVLVDKELREKLTSICKGQTFVSQAPVTIAICCNNTDYIMTCGHKANIIDGAIIGEHIALQAAELGLGSCWIGAFYQKEMAELINLPKDYEVVALLPIGYPDMDRPIRSLKKITEIVVYNRF